jgi:glutathione S-transferase
MIALHYYPSNASFAPHIVLEELGVPFQLKLVDRTQNAHQSVAYLKLNPNGLIPVFVDGDLVLYESAAICLHLADTHPTAMLAPAVGTAARAHFYKWLMWSTNSLQANLIPYFYPDRSVAPGNAEGAAQVKRAAQRKIGAYLKQLNDTLANHRGRWLLGEHYTVVDPYIFMLCRWTRFFEGEVLPARTFTHLGAHMQRMLARPAVQRAIATEKLPEPLI